VAVGRQYSGTMGRVENVIVAVYTTYAADRGHALIDRDRYAQEDWSADPAPMAAAGFPPDHAVATTPALAPAQAKRALSAGISPGWAAGDEVHGRSAALREFSEAAGIGYVSAVPAGRQLTTSGQVRMRADQALHLAGPRGRNRRPCGAGAKGRRYHGWAWIATGHPRRWLLIRRSISDPGEPAYFCAHAPEHRACSLTDLVKIAGTRRKAEDEFPGPEIRRLTRPGTSQALPGPGNATSPRRWRPSRSSPQPLPSSGPRTPPPSCPASPISPRPPTAALSR